MPRARPLSRRRVPRLYHVEVRPGDCFAFDFVTSPRLVRQAGLPANGAARARNRAAAGCGFGDAGGEVPEASKEVHRGGGSSPKDVLPINAECVVSSRTRSWPRRRRKACPRRGYLPTGSSSSQAGSTTRRARFDPMSGRGGRRVHLVRPVAADALDGLRALRSTMLRPRGVQPDERTRYESPPDRPPRLAPALPATEQLRRRGHPGVPATLPDGTAVPRPTAPCSWTPDVARSSHTAEPGAGAAHSRRAARCARR